VLLTGTAILKGKSEMPEKASEKSKMSSVDFAQHALRNHIAPSSIGSVKERIRLASRRLGWSHSRTKDAWYADPRISISADEIRGLEQETGLRYGQQELTELETYIARADALLDGPDADFYRPFVAAFRAFHRALARPGTEG
jgi:hypothetical protein